MEYIEGVTDAKMRGYNKVEEVIKESIEGHILEVLRLNK